jgi:hypothetical protein
MDGFDFLPPLQLALAAPATVEPSGGESPVVDRDAIRALAAERNCELVESVDITPEVLDWFRWLGAVGKRRDPGKHLMARSWLIEHGVLIDLAHPRPARSTASEPAPDAVPLIPVPAPLVDGEPPAHPMIENAVLGRLVISPELISTAREKLRPGHFSSAERMRLWTKLCDLSERGQPIDVLLVENEFARTGMASLAARDLLSHAIMSPAATHALPRYCEILGDYASRRAGFLAGRQLLDDISRGVPASESLARARTTLERAETDAETESPPLTHRSWPDPIDPAAYHGLAGEFVRRVAPRTEADPVAILAQFLVCYGSVIGRRAHFVIDATRHYCNEYLVVCGLTSRGRKGTSWRVTKLLFERCDPNWVEVCHHSGVGSGEGMIRTVRDPVFTQTKIGSEMVSTLEDPGADDKRALWMEEEFQGVLAVMKREGSTLSSWIRRAWDGSTLENANKNSPMRATNAHVSMIGQITFDELIRCLPPTDISNGFANRFLWLCARRSNVLPMGGDLLSAEFRSALKPLADRLDEAVKHGSDELANDIAIGFTDEARDLYIPAYHVLTRTRLGTIGNVTSRAESHVRRLALIYALLDRAYKVDVPHLKAALALWDYCERSALFIFGDQDVDPVAERILEAIMKAGDDGLSQNAIARKLFAGRKAEQVDQALGRLVNACLIQQVERPTKGRPAKVWVSCQ